MTYKNKECKVQIKKGIEIQKENKIEAVNCFQRAYKLNPLNKDVYINLGKALMGIGQYEFSMKSFLTYAHFLILENQKKFSSINQNFYYKHYEYDSQITENVFAINNKTINHSKICIAISSFETDYIIQIQDTNLTRLIPNLDLIADIGMCYITKHQNILKFNKIPESLLINELKFIHKMKFDGSILRKSKYGNMIRTIGLIFAAKNLLTNPEISQIDLTNIYFTEEYKLDDI